MSKHPLIRINGKPYRLVVLKVVGRDELGRPRKLEAMYEGESTSVQDGTEFITVFAPSETIAARKN